MDGKFLKGAGRVGSAHGDEVTFCHNIVDLNA